MSPGRCAATLLLAACAGPPAEPSRTPWTPTRHEYARFRQQHPEIVDPNYLPFMAHRFRFEAAREDRLVLCRWADERLPLRVHVRSPEIAPEIQNEFRPVSPQVYVTAVRRALDEWEEALEGVLRFEQAGDPDDADLVVELVGSVGPAPDPDVQVLGITPVARACRVRGEGTSPDAVEVEFDVEQIAVYLADRFGLLTPDQVERIALHELGHALGMRGHSPIPADVMYEVARDRTVGRLSVEDVNSFRALYGLPNGTVYARLPEGAALSQPAARGPDGPPELEVEPYRDERLGFAVRLARGWMRIPTSYGVVSVDGVAWDYDASLQIIVRSYPNVDLYLARHGAAHVGGAEILEHERIEDGERTAVRLLLERPDAPLVEEHRFLETGDGRLVISITDASSELYEDFAPWFDAVLDSLDVFAPSR